MKVFYENRRDKELYFRKAHTLAFGAHMHESVEIVCLLEGTAHAFANGKDYMLGAGDFFVVFPNSIHYYDSCVDNKAVVMIVPMSMVSEFRNILTTKTPVSSVVRTVDRRAVDLIRTAMEYDGKFRDEAVRGMILAAFSMILEKMSFSDKSKYTETTIEAILEFCQEHYKEELSLKVIADNLGISKSHISHIFTNKIHMGFCDYVNSIRLNMALKLIEQTNRSITDIGSESGFCTIRTFNRAFKKKFGMSPRQYRIMN